MMGYTQMSGGPLWVNHHDIRKYVDGKMCPISYLRGMVSEKGEGLQGHHATHTLGIVDEASSAENIVHEMMSTWAKRLLIFGNPLPCDNFFRKAVREGDILYPSDSNGLVSRVK